MKAKNRIFDLLVQGKGATAKTFYEKEVLNRWFDLTLAREFGWTQKDILFNTTQDFYDDAVLLLQKEAFFRKVEADKDKNKLKK